MTLNVYIVNTIAAWSTRLQVCWWIFFIWSNLKSQIFVLISHIFEIQNFEIYSLCPQILLFLANFRQISVANKRLFYPQIIWVPLFNHAR